VSRLASRPLDLARRLWEICVIHGLEHGRVALLTKLYHAAVDEQAGLKILNILFDQSPAGRDVPPPPATAPEREPGDLELVARSMASLPRQLVRAAQATPRTLRHLDQVPTMRNLPGTGSLSRAADQTYRLLTRDQDGEIVTQPTGKAPSISMGGPISAHRRFSFISLDLTTLKSIKDQAPGTTLNDVVVALCAGALRRRLKARGDLLTEPLVAAVPISVRRSQDEEGNHISMMYVRIPTDEPDPQERLRRSREVMSAAKSVHGAVPAPVMQDAAFTTPPAMLGRAARTMAVLGSNGWIDPPHNVTISNVPGWQAPLYCAGAKVIAQYPVNVLLDGMAASLTFLSYMDHMDVGITTDRDNVPDVWELAQDFGAELDEMATRLSTAGHTK
jgi:diacylglycerol O-acyltransferase